MEVRHPTSAHREEAQEDPTTLSIKVKFIGPGTEDPAPMILALARAGQE